MLVSIELIGLAGSRDTNKPGSFSGGVDFYISHWVWPAPTDYYGPIRGASWELIPEAAIPEPGTWSFLVIGLVGMGGLRRLRRRRVPSAKNLFQNRSRS